MAEILRSSAKVSAAVLASRVLGVVRESLFASRFAITSLSDVYVVAFRIPNLLRDLFAEGALSSAFVPTFSEALTKEGKDAAYRLGNLVLSGALLVTGILTLIGIAESGAIVSLMSGGFAGADASAADKAIAAVKLVQATTLTRIMMPILAIISGSAIWMGMLNAQRRFTVPALAPALFNVTSILAGAGVVVSALDDWRAMLAWSAATTLAAGVQAFCQLPALWRLGYRPRLRLAGLWHDPRVRRIVRLMAPACLGLAAIQINVLVNTQFASKLGTGPVSQLYYAFRLFYLPVGVFGVALGTVTTTRVSEEAARGDRTALIARTTDGVRGVFMLASASAVGLIVLAQPTVELLFQHGKFTAVDTAALVPVVQVYMLGVLPYSLVKVIAPAFYTLDQPRVPMIASIAAVAVTVTFNGLTYRQFHAWGGRGAWGLALGTTIAALANFSVLRSLYAKRVGRLATARARELGALVVANAVLGAAAWALWRVCGSGLALVRPHVPRLLAKSLLAAALFFTIGAAFVVYAEVLRRLRYPGAEELTRIPRKIARKLRGA